MFTAKIQHVGYLCCSDNTFYRFHPSGLPVGGGCLPACCVAGETDKNSLERIPMALLSEIRRRTRQIEAGLGKAFRNDDPIKDGPFKGLRPSQVRELLKAVAKRGSMGCREPKQTIKKDTSDE
jgi:hypothetical protein